MERATALLAGLSAPNVPALPAMVVGARNFMLSDLRNHFCWLHFVAPSTFRSEGLRNSKSTIPVVSGSAGRCHSLCEARGGGVNRWIGITPKILQRLSTRRL